MAVTGVRGVRGDLNSCDGVRGAAIDCCRADFGDAERGDAERGDAERGDAERSRPRDALARPPWLSERRSGARACRTWYAERATASSLSADSNHARTPAAGSTILAS